MKVRSTLLTLATVAGLGLGLGSPSQAATTYQGHLTVGNVPIGLPDDAGGAGVTMQAFLTACRVDLLSGSETGAIAQMLASPLNGHDAFIVDMKKEKMGAFAAKGPGAAPIGPEVSGIQLMDYDLDLDFYSHPSSDSAARKPTGCHNANAGTKCPSHKANPDEKTSCISGFKDSKGKVHGARYVVVNASTELKGPMNITITTP